MKCLLPVSPWVCASRTMCPRCQYNILLVTVLYRKMSPCTLCNTKIEDFHTFAQYTSVSLRNYGGSPLRTTCHRIIVRSHRADTNSTKSFFPAFSQQFALATNCTWVICRSRCLFKRGTNTPKYCSRQCRSIDHCLSQILYSAIVLVSASRPCTFLHCDCASYHYCCCIYSSYGVALHLLLEKGEHPTCVRAPREASGHCCRGRTVLQRPNGLCDAQVRILYVVVTCIFIKMFSSHFVLFML